MTVSQIHEPPTYFKEVYVDTQAIVTGTSAIPPKQALVFGHIGSLLFDYTLAVTIGNGVVAVVPAQNAINTLVIRDSNNKPVLDCTGAQLSRVRKMLSGLPSLGFDEYRKSEYDAGANIGATGGNYRVEIPIHIPIDLQPITLEYTVGVLSDILGTVGTATATGTLRVLTKNYVTALDEEQTRLARVRRVKVQSLGTITDEQSFQSRLPKGGFIESLYLDMVADANLTDATFKFGGNVGFDKVLERYFAMLEARRFDDGHTPAGYYNLPITPGVVAENTEFRITPSTSVTPILYMTYRMQAEA